MQKVFLSLFVISASIVAKAQENCSNALDDDSDGLIDLNDPDCVCNGIGGSWGVTSLIPNPSFEDMLCCPNNDSQLHCANFWAQASDATSDYYNLCDHAGWADTILPGAPGGAGYAGFYSKKNWEENIGVCLIGPMTAGTNYTLDFYMAWHIGSKTLDLTLYGTPNCGDLPWVGLTCPIGSGAWMTLGSTTVTFPPGWNKSWQHATLNFTPTVNIDAVSIGGPCGGQVAGSNYYFIDELTLATTASFAENVTITKGGSWCNLNVLGCISTVPRTF